MALTEKAIRGIERLLRRRYGVHEYTNDPACIFRIALRIADKELKLQDGTLVRSGDAVVELHLWNEQLPTIARDGATIAWGASVDRRIRRSLALLAARLANQPSVVAVHGEAAFGCHMGDRQARRFAARYGFEIIDDSVLLRGQLRHFCDDFLFWGLTRTFNPNGLRGKPFHRNRHHIWMSRSELDTRWGHRAISMRRASE